MTFPLPSFLPYSFPQQTEALTQYSQLTLRHLTLRIPIHPVIQSTVKPSCAVILASALMRRRNLIHFFFLNPVMIFFPSCPPALPKSEVPELKHQKRNMLDQIKYVLLLYSSQEKPLSLFNTFPLISSPQPV